MELNEFFKEISKHSKDKKRNRTINVTDDLHAFYKKVSSHYNVSISTIISNVLENWREKHRDEIMKDILKKLDKDEF